MLCKLFFPYAKALRELKNSAAEVPIILDPAFDCKVYKKTSLLTDAMPAVLYLAVHFLNRYHLQIMKTTKLSVCRSSSAWMQFSPHEIKAGHLRHHTLENWRRISVSML